MELTKNKIFFLNIIDYSLSPTEISIAPTNLFNLLYVPVKLLIKPSLKLLYTFISIKLKTDILNLENEKRVLITKDKQIYSNGDIDETIKIKILERVTKYHVVDIAYCTNIGEWIIVENNPLFSIGLNDINEEDYISFIINSWKNIKLE